MMRKLNPAACIVAGVTFSLMPTFAMAQRWETNDDYPDAARRVGAQGDAEFSVLVGTDGKPKECRVTKSAGHPALDTATCDLIMRRARFNPAKDESGKPKEFYYANRVRWRMPD